MPIAMMDKATPTSRARKPFFFLAKNLNDLSSFLRKKKMQGMDPSLKATWSVIIIVEWDFFSCEMQLWNL